MCAPTFRALQDVIRRHEQYLEEAEGVEQAEKEKLFQKHMLGSMGGAVVVVPSAADLTAEELEAWKEVEESFAANTLTSPYYFLQDSEEFQEVYRLVKENAASGGLSTLLQLIEGHSYQLVSSASQPSRIKGAEGALIQVRLSSTMSARTNTPHTRARTRTHTHTHTHTHTSLSLSLSLSLSRTHSHQLTPA